MKLLPLIAAVALLSFCGGDDGADTLPLPEMPARLKRAICEKVFSCCSEAERQKNPKLGKDRASCEAGLDRDSVFLLADLQTSVAGGRIVYHADRMATCLAELQTRSCDAVKMPASETTVAELCSGVIESKVPTGGACTEYWDCIGGWCAGDSGDLGDRCAPIKPDGADCDEGPECASGLCNEDRICARRPTGTGNICALGTVILGQHGAAP